MGSLKRMSEAELSKHFGGRFRWSTKSVSELQILFPSATLNIYVGGRELNNYPGIAGRQQ